MSESYRKPAFIESMTKMQVEGLTIRIWREESAPKLSPSKLLSDLQSVFSDIHDEVLDEIGDIALAVGAVDTAITAVEVLDPEGDGVVLYFQWP